MTKKTIFSVNTVVPGDELIEINYASDHTLLDADIILFTPLFPYGWYRGEPFQGKRCLSESGSFKAKEQSHHWKNEIVSAANVGKLVVVYLEKPDECFRYTGNKQTSGTGRNQKVTNIVEPISSYDALPNIDSYTTKTGSKIKLTKAGEIIAPYWNEFSKYTSYYSVVEGKFTEVLLESEQGSRIVGSMIKSRAGGAILFLPPVNFFNAEFIVDYKKYSAYFGDNYTWTEAGIQAGKRFVTILTSLREAISASTTKIPPPDWTSADQYRLSEEGHLEKNITQISKKLTHLEETKIALREELAVAGWPRQLLYENGTPLEDAIIQSLKLMGFKAESFDDGKSEFDSVFSAPEGRFLGEAEGRDNKAISIDKFSQLLRNLHEDLVRDEVDNIAKGVLFGNGYRLSAPEERGELFTEKCLTEAQRIGIVLVRTTDMFGPTRYLVEHPDDQNYAKACRKAIADTAGGIVKFPEPSIRQPMEIDKKSITSKDD